VRKRGSGEAPVTAAGAAGESVGNATTEPRAVLDHYEVPVAHAAALTEFLQEVFGWKNRAPDPSKSASRSAVGGEDRRLDTPAFAGGTQVGLLEGRPEILKRPIPVARLEGERLETCLERVLAAGGIVVLPPTEIAEGGRFARFLDPEGNEWGVFTA